MEDVLCYSRTIRCHGVSPGVFGGKYRPGGDVYVAQRMQDFLTAPWDIGAYISVTFTV